MFRPIYKLSSPYLSLSFTHSTTLTLTVLFCHAFFLIVRCFVHSEIWTPKKKKKFLHKKFNRCISGRSLSDPTEAAPPKIRSRFRAPQNADDQISSSFFFFIALELSDSASRLSLQWPWEASISNGQFQAPTFPCVYVSEFESVRVIGFANLEVKNFVGFFFFLQVRWVFLVDAGDECVSFNGVLIVFLLV